MGLKTIMVHGSLELAGGCFLLLLIAVWKDSSMSKRPGP